MDIGHCSLLLPMVDLLLVLRNEAMNYFLVPPHKYTDQSG